MTFRMAGAAVVLAVAALIELVIDHRVSGPDGDSHWLAFAERLVSISVGALFWAAAGAHASTDCRRRPGTGAGLDVREPGNGPPLVGWLLFITFLVGPAVFLLQGLVRGWSIVFPQWIPWIGGRRVPRLLPLVPAWLVAPTLTLYGFGSIVYAVVVHASLVGLGGAASLAFACYGTALTLTALSYQRRTRPVCEAARQSRQK